MGNLILLIFSATVIVCCVECFSNVPSQSPIISVSSFDGNGFDFIEDGQPLSTDFLSALSADSTPSSGSYWWLNQKSPFVVAPQSTVFEVPPTTNVLSLPISNEITEVKYEQSNPFLNAFFKDTSLCTTSTTYTCVTKVSCTELGYVCAPKELCQNGFIGRNNLGLLTSQNSRYCSTDKEVCCKITDCISGCQSKNQHHVGETVAVTSTYQQANYAASEYSHIPSHTIASSVQSTYTGPQNTSPHPGCAAALKCVPDNYCTVEGIMSDFPVPLTKELLQSRVPLSECLDPSTGIVGKCCRDPNYKDPWPDHTDYDHGFEHNHGQSYDHTFQHIKVPVVQTPSYHYTTQKPLVPFVPPTTEKVIYQPPYSVSQAHYVPPTPTQTYIPPRPPTPPPQTYIPPKPPTSPPPQVYLPPQPVVPPVPPSPPSQQYLPPKPKPPTIAYLPPPPSVYKPVPVLSRNPYEAPPPLVYKPVPVLSKNPYEAPPVSEPLVIPVQEKQQYTGQCGVKVGDDTEFGEAPWYALVYSTRVQDLSCGGVIVSENAVLSSASCVEKADADSLIVKIGPNSRIYKIAAIARHPEYDSHTRNKDLALIILKESIQFGSYVQKVCLPPIQTQTQSEYKECYVSTVSDYYNPGVLQKYKVQTLSFKDCETRLKNTYLGKYFILKDTFTCGVTPAEVDLCQVKAGEPLVCNKGDGSFELFGIKSWDLGCKDYKKVVIFANNDLVWLEDTLVAPLQKVIAVQESNYREKFKGESLEGVNIDQKPGFGLGYGK